MRGPLWVRRLGVVDYEEAWAMQKRTVEARVAGEIPDVLFLLEHPHVYTLGRSGHAENVLLDKPAPGVWQVMVAAHRIAWDQHRETTAWDQDYALVVSGVVQD